TRRALGGLWHTYEQGGQFDQGLIETVQANTGVDVVALFTEQGQQDVAAIKAALLGGGEDGAPVDRQAAIEAFYRLNKPMFNKGIGESAPNGQTIVEKRLADYVLSPDGKEVAFQLEVITEDKVGNLSSYFPPATEGRGISDAAAVLKRPVAAVM